MLGPCSPSSSKILLATLNASYIHSAFGLRYILANMAELREQTVLCEFTINQRPLDIVEAILRHEPTIVGLGIYIWNASETLAVVSALKRLRPSLIIVLGGPEVSFECDQQEIVRLADYVITGEADVAFRDLCRQLLRGEAPPLKLIAAPLPKMEEIELPYHLYDDKDIASRVVYIEASRGCPFTCEFCLSSLDIPVRAVALDRLLPELEALLNKGLRQFKFVDRTFNLNLTTSRTLLEFFLERWTSGLFLHFEMIPDRLPEGLREIIAKFPPGSLQFEVGIQTFDEAASKNISRRNNHAKLEDNFHFLRQHTGVHIHADLIVGLPGEDVEGFGRGFDRLLALGPQEIQIGILKRLRGTPITRHDKAYGMIYSASPPYDILQNDLIPFAEMQEMKRFAAYWDIIGNSGNFALSLAFLWEKLAADRSPTSPFNILRHLFHFLWAETAQVTGIQLLRLVELVFRWATSTLNLSPTELANILWSDYKRPGRNGDKPPKWIQPFLHEPMDLPPERLASSHLPNRQARHEIKP